MRRIADGVAAAHGVGVEVAFNTEFTKAPICTASRAYQRRKLHQLEEAGLSGDQLAEEGSHVTAKACICHDLAGGATGPSGLDPAATTAVCCGPNGVYFSRIAGEEATFVVSAEGMLTDHGVHTDKYLEHLVHLKYMR